jgi:D-alanine-D-alanine ligase
MSARSVMAALDPDRYKVVPIGINKAGRWLGGQNVLDALESGREAELTPVTLLPEPGTQAVFTWQVGEALQVLEPIEIAFPVLHGTYGEDGTVQGLLELADLPYVGAGVLASSVAMDKSVFKDVMRAHAIPVVDWELLLATDLADDLDGALNRAESLGPYPLFTKPANLGSSVGISKCVNRADLVEGLMHAAQYDRRILVERGLHAREIEVSVLGNEHPEASIAGEIVPGDEFYSYEAKYIDDSSQLLIPAPLDESVSERARELACAAFEAIDGAGFARVDFLLDGLTDELFLNEINTIPGFTKISMYPKLWEASGVPYPILLDRLIELAFERHAQKAQLVRTYGGGE